MTWLIGLGVGVPTLGGIGLAVPLVTSSCEDLLRVLGDAMGDGWFNVGGSCGKEFASILICCGPSSFSVLMMEVVEGD